MTDSRNSCSCVKGVVCDVQGCKYHNKTSNCCTADHIDVQNKSALSKSETYCGTFCPKGSC